MMSEEFKEELKQFLRENLEIVIKDDSRDFNNSVSVGIRIIGDNEIFSSERIYIPD